MTPFKAYYHALYNNYPKEDLEPVIKTHSYFSYLYAKNILKQRFYLGEESIAFDSEYAYLYAKNIIKGPWEEGELSIAKSKKYAYNYAKNILKGRFTPGEREMRKDPVIWGYYKKLINLNEVVQKQNWIKNGF